MMKTRMKMGSFKLDESFVNQYAGEQPNWGPIGYITYKRTYSRPLPDGNNEEFWQTCQRVVEGEFSIQKDHCLKNRLPWSDAKAQRTAQKTFKAMWEFKFLPPGRGLWAMGTKHIETVGGMALNNCAFISTKNIGDWGDNPFAFLMDCSMLGVGVGFDTLGAGLQIYPINFSNNTYNIPDTREGWVTSTSMIIDAFLRGMPLDTFDYSLVRKAGEPIKGFGGVSSGPEPLIELHNSIIELVRDKNVLTSSMIVDIMNMIGKCVIAGNVRRSAEIALGDPYDHDFLTLKQDKDKLLSHRWASNNSVLSDIGMDYTELAGHTSVNGEPGYVWLDNCRKFSRLKDPPDWKDTRVMGVNPCSEQTLESYEVCCLVETFIARHENLADYIETIKLAYLYAKTVTLVPTHWDETNSVMLRNRRIGTSMSGITKAFGKWGKRAVLEMADKAYSYINGLDTQYSQWLCVPNSIKKTSVKPSGTVSLLPGEPPGIHYPIAEYYIRRIRFASNSEYLPILREAGIPLELDKSSPNTMVASFPCKEDFFTKSEDQVSMWEQLENIAQFQYYWADNAVSATVKFNENEAADIHNALELYETRLKAISFLPYSSHGYEQAPYEPITKDQYLNLMKSVNFSLIIGRKIDESADGGKNLYCEGDRCEIKTNG
jgi:adenosylcobalamin-dependent ribonucleoside-triphosphate reductase